MPDYFCWALWRDDPAGPGPYNLDPSTLPLSEKTIADLQRWIDAFSEGAHAGNPADRPWPPGRLEEFDAEGLRLWRQVRRELGPGFEVRYQQGSRVRSPEEDPLE